MWQLCGRRRLAKSLVFGPAMESWFETLVELPVPQRAQGMQGMLIYF